MKNIIGLILLVVILLSNVAVSYAQISYGGIPNSLKTELNGIIPFISLPEVDNLLQLDIDENEDGFKKPFRFAKMHDVSIDIFQIAIADSLSDGVVWRVGVVSSNALSLYSVFSSFLIPDGASLFVYNPSAKHILGKFTIKNNKVNRKFSILPIEGDTIIFEYFEPFNSSFKGEIVIGRIGHDYRGIISLLNDEKDGSFGTSGDCNIDINCFEGANWQKEKHSVCRLIANGSFCTGTLINNTNEDARPFFLTANHCISEQSYADNMLCIFNYESATCNGLDGSVEQSISGGIVRATTDNIDFCLIELTDSPLPSFHPYFAGWNSIDSAAVKTTCIHHPHGDVKKISKDYNSPTTGDYGYGYDMNSHWLVSDWELGTTEGGSSGSPLFNQNHQVIGDLTGGEANCQNSVNDYFSKFSLAWDTYPDSSQQLKFWLDPTETGKVQINGFNPYYGQNVPIADFVSSQTEILVGSTVDFTDLSDGNVTSWNWTFNGAVPNTSTEQHPTGIKYTYDGIFLVRLTSTNAYGSTQVIKQDYITVSDGCIRSTNIATDETIYLYTFSGSEWGYWTGHNEHGFSEFAERYTNQTGHFIHGVYILPARADYGDINNNITIRVWDGGGEPGNVIYSMNKTINSFTPGVWKYIPFEPAIETDGSFYVGYKVYYNQQDTFAVPHAQPRGAGGLNTTFVKEGNFWKAINSFSPDMSISLCVEPYICGTLTSITEESNQPEIKVFPNPAYNQVFVDLLDMNTGEVSIKLLSSTGQIIRIFNNNTTDGLLTLDIKGISNGVYFLIISGEQYKIVKQLVIVN